MHREAENFIGGFFGDGELAGFVAVRREDRLFVDGYGIVNSRRDAFGFQFGGDFVAAGDANRVLRVDVGVAFLDFRNIAAVFEFFGIARADADAGLDFVFEMGPLGQQHGSLDGVESAVHADERMVMAFDAAVGADGAHFVGERIIAGEKGAAFAVAAERFCGKEAGAGYFGDATTAFAVLGRAETLGSVFNDGHIMFCANAIDGVAIGHLAKEADRNDGFGARGDGGFDLADVDVVSVGLDVDENGFRADEQDDFSSADPGERDGDDFVARADVECAQGDFEAVGAAGDGEAMTGLGILGQRLFELGVFRAENVLAVFENFFYARVDFGLVTAVLGLEVDEVHLSL